jgi:hypothetical protein
MVLHQQEERKAMKSLRSDSQTPDQELILGPSEYEELNHNIWSYIWIVIIYTVFCSVYEIDTVICKCLSYDMSTKTLLAMVI